MWFNIQRILMKVAQDRSSTVLRRVVRLATIKFNLQISGKRKLLVASGIHHL
jgi:hypothetical protein